MTTNPRNVVNRFIVFKDGRFALVFNLSDVLGDLGQMNVRLPLYRNPGQEIPVLTDFVDALSALCGTVEVNLAAGGELTLVLEDYVAHRQLIPYLQQVQQLLATLGKCHDVVFTELRLGRHNRQALINALLGCVIVHSASALVNWISKTVGDEVSETARRS